MAQSTHAAPAAADYSAELAEARSIRAAHDAVEFATEIAIARQMLADGRTLEEVWRHLRATGRDMSDSIRVTMAITGLPPHEAKRALYLSVTWADMQPAVDRLQDEMIEAALSMGAEVRIDGKRITSLSELEP